MTFLDMTARLARVLLTMEAEQNSPGVVRASHEELANALGCLRQSVTRMIALWRRMGYVKTSRGQISILNRRKLQAYIQE
jgi:CRP/FNR family transcriptional regulator